MRTTSNFSLTINGIVRQKDNKHILYMAGSAQNQLANLDREFTITF